jgi:hypothetical protein
MALDAMSTNPVAVGPPGAGIGYYCLLGAFGFSAAALLLSLRFRKLKTPEGDRRAMVALWMGIAFFFVALYFLT